LTRRVKAAAPDLVHKSDIGAVRLNAGAELVAGVVLAVDVKLRLAPADGEPDTYVRALSSAPAAATT
jgi:hypothetical protein